MLRWSGVDDEVRSLERRTQIVRRAQRRCQRERLQESLVLVARVDRRSDVRLERPNRGVVAVGREEVGEGRSPRSGTDHRGAHQPNLAAMKIAAATTSAIGTIGFGRLARSPLLLPNRCSWPARRRWMFARWVQKTNTA